MMDMCTDTSLYTISILLANTLFIVILISFMKMRGVSIGEH